MSLLIIDDDEGMREALQEMLKDSFDCRLARDGKEGSEFLGLNDFDVVVTDIDMPCGGGERILTEVSIKENTHAYVFTGGHSIIDHRRYLVCGAKFETLRPQ